MDDVVEKRISEKDARVHLFHHIHMAFSFLSLFIAYSGLQNLLSTIVKEDGLGYWSLATIYIVLCVSSITIGPAAVTFLKPRISFVIGSACYLSFIIANNWPSWGTLITTGAFIGIGGSIIWTAQGVYLTQCASNYALKLGESRKSAMGLFTGVFFAIFQMTQIIGNLIAGLVLSSKNLQSEKILIYTYTVLGGLGFLSFWFIRPEEDSTITAIMDSQPISEKVFKAILKLREKTLLLLVPIIFYSGIEQGFIFGSFTADIISASIGSGSIGFVMALFGVADVAGSFALGKIADRFGLAVLIYVGVTVHMIFLLGIYIILEIKTIEFFSNREWILYLSAAVYGLGDAAWNTFPSIMLSTLFTDDTEAAFANLKFWQALGSVLPFAVGHYLEIHLKLVCVFGFLIFGVMALIYLQVFFNVFSKRENIEETKVLVEETVIQRNRGNGRRL